VVKNPKLVEELVALVPQEVRIVLITVVGLYHRRLGRAFLLLEKRMNLCKQTQLLGEGNKKIISGSKEWRGTNDVYLIGDVEKEGGPAEDEVGAARVDLHPAWARGAEHREERSRSRVG
jgi:hypothetical protein